MRRFLASLPLCLALILGAALPAAEGASAPTVDQLVETLNPDTFARDANGHPVHPITNAFTSPASDIARDVANNNWYNLAIYLPFLILPQLLLLYVIFKFRDRKDGRKPATFTGNHTLEIVWTAIPCLALAAIVLPAWKLLWKMELPPAGVERAVVVEVRGKSFAWDYKYQNDNLSIGQDVAGIQEPLVLEKDRPAILNITSNDVNHAWWIPSFGVKKDAIIGRYTNVWFTPDTLGTFKGQCAELCGQGHGIMWISSVVVTPEVFNTYRGLLRHRNDTVKLWNVLAPGAAADDKELDAQLAKYLEKGRNEDRLLALRFWIASNYASVSRKRQPELTPEQVVARGKERRAQLDAAIARAVRAN